MSQNNFLKNLWKYLFIQPTKHCVEFKIRVDYGDLMLAEEDELLQ